MYHIESSGFKLFPLHTVDGTNPAPVDMVVVPLFTGFHANQVVIAGFLPSTVAGLTGK